MALMGTVSWTLSLLFGVGEEALVPFRRYAETVGSATSFTSLPTPPSGDPR
jgi:hypothetical protein